MQRSDGGWWSRGILLTLTSCVLGLAAVENSQEAIAAEWQVGMAQVDITPPLNFPMAGYYHERLATGQKEPLWAKAVVLSDGTTQAAWVVCDLTGVSIDLSTHVRQRASEATGIPVAHIVVSGTHSHTAPDYYKALYDFLGPPEDVKGETAKERAAYAGKLIDGAAQAIIQAQKKLQLAQISSTTVVQEKPVSFCRRFVMRDGSVSTWVGLKHPQAIRSTTNIDPDIQLVKFQSQASQKPIGLISNFALHLDTVGGTEWSADYPYYIQEKVVGALGADVISLFGTGCCGDINHVDPLGEARNKTDVIGGALGSTIVAGLSTLQADASGPLQARSMVVPLTLEEVSAADVRHSLELVLAAKKGEKIDFFQHVTAYKRLILDQLHNAKPTVDASEALGLGLSRTWTGVGETLPVEVHTFTLGSDVAFVFLPGEVFVELGTAIKKASPFRTTIVVELSQSVETIYIPNTQGYIGGGYEPTNSLVQVGSGEKLVQAAVTLLRQSATALAPQP